MKSHFIVLLGLLGPLTCRAEPVSVGNWSVDTNGKYVSAYTVNESESVFGMLCDSESCVFYTNLRTTCEKGTQYQSLISGSAGGATAMVLHCRPITENGQTRYILLIGGFDDMEQIVMGGGVLGIAVVLQSGEFNVSRFDLKDARRATELAASQATKVKSKARTGDQRL